MKKQLISQALESHLSELVSMSDQIYDFAEPGMEEIQSSSLLTEYLKAKGCGRMWNCRTSDSLPGCIRAGQRWSVLWFSGRI